MSVMDNSDRVRELLDSLDRLRYVLVVRRTTDTAPAMARPGTFASGEYGADVLLFELESGRFLGAFTIHARNSPKIESITTIDGEALERDLSANAQRSLRNELSNHLPAVAGDERFCT